MNGALVPAALDATHGEPSGQSGSGWQVMEDDHCPQPLSDSDEALRVEQASRREEGVMHSQRFWIRLWDGIYTNSEDERFDLPTRRGLLR